MPPLAKGSGKCLEFLVGNSKGADRTRARYRSIPIMSLRPGRRRVPARESD